MQLIEKMNLLNGWRRLWVVAIAVGWFSMIGWAWILVNNMYYGDFYYRSLSDILLESMVPACSDYVNEPIATLPEQEFDGPCWNLDFHRRFDAKRYGDIRPYTEEVFKANIVSKWRKEFLIVVIVSTVGVLIASALVYFFGVVTAWVIRGFRR